MMTNLVDCDFDTLRIGQRVQLVFRAYGRRRARPLLPARLNEHVRRSARGNPRGGQETLRAVSGRVLAQARSRARLSDRVRPRADRGRLSLGADPGGIRRLRPRAFGGGGDPGDDPGRGLQRCRVPRADVHHGHDPAPRLGRAEAAVPAGDRARRAAAAGVRRHRADQRHRHHRAAHLRPPRRRPLHRQRPEDLDQPRRAFRPDAAAGAHHAARADGEAHRGPVDLHRRYARGARATG